MIAANNKSILICDDDENLGIMLRGFLRFNGYKVALATDGQKALQELKKEKYDLLVLDVTMPHLDGFQLSKKISEDPSISLPIVFLTSKSQKEDVLTGYKMGGADYLTKPFDSELLLYKIEAILKHSSKDGLVPSGASPTSTAKKHELQVDENEFYLFDNYKLLPMIRELVNVKTNKVIHLAPKETALLQWFCLNESKLVKKDDLLNNLWGNTSFLSNRSMNVFLVKIRKYFKDSPSINIKSIYKVGYKFSVVGGVKIKTSE